MERPVVPPSAARLAARLAWLGLVVAVPSCGARTELGAACVDGQAHCNGVCTYLASDWMNCGTCGKACPSGQQCRDGACQPCPPGQSMCQDRCIDPRADHQNCGGCGQPCSQDQSCIAGRCECRTGETTCGERCVSTEDDPQNCGECGHSCPHGLECHAGRCEAPCPPGQQLCSADCVDTANDVRNCGACNVACSATQACLGGRCRCASGTTSCGGLCVELRGDSNNCGRCGNLCRTGETCVAGQCCAAGTTVCQGACVDVLTDAFNCGYCGRICNSAEVCAAGRCVAPCGSTGVLCAGRCVDPTSDPQNCGACARACASDEVCSGSSCVRPCLAQLLSPVADAWGARFDGLERRAASWAEAKASCEAIGGRLPTATELWRVAANRYGPVGQTYLTNPLWSLTPAAKDSQITVALSDGTTSATASSAATTRTYRCVCPTPNSSSFDTRTCFGPPGAPCQSLATEGGHQQIDLYDRAPLPRGAAMWECSFAHGRLPTAVGYLEAIVKGLANGSDTLLHTGDEASSGSDVLVKWSGTATGWVANATTVASGSYSSFRPFRCSGASLISTVKPVSIADEFVPTSALLLGERTDRPSSPWPNAHDGCWNSGGHLPRTVELGALVELGLPSGSNSWTWTADGLGTSGAVLLTQSVRWSATQAGFFTELNVNPVAKSTNPGLAFRCIWYYYDTDYLGPSSLDCAGATGCQRLPLGAGQAAMWIDKVDRPSASLVAAVSTCVNAGGHLASERDLTEAIRRGLPNGTSTPLLTSDLTSAGMMTVRWTGTDPGFSDQAPIASGTGALTDVRPYRCVWTNEHR